jgi:hypothetical protein
MIKQPFTFGKYLLGIILFSILAGYGVSRKDEYQNIFVYGLMLYTTLGFILWVYQTIKYGKLNRRERKLFEMELRKRESELSK